jgi:hypothetical protein
MSDSHFIDGIFNYCDRWCERCALTARCRLFAMERELHEAGGADKLKQSDHENADFWRKLDLAGEPDIEPADFDDQVEQWRSPEIGHESEEGNAFEAALAAQREEQIEEAPLIALAHRYAMEASRWLDGSDKQVAALPAGDPEHGPAPITAEEALSILSWYVFQIKIKLVRALSGALEVEQEEAFAEFDDDDEWEFDDDGEWDTHASDADGSAKVALIGIERSIGAWTALRGLAPSHDPAIRRFQQMLARLRHMVDEQFPGARTFLRPGFDDPPDV